MMINNVRLVELNISIATVSLNIKLCSHLDVEDITD